MPHDDGRPPGVATASHLKLHVVASLAPIIKNAPFYWLALFLV